MTNTEVRLGSGVRLGPDLETEDRHRAAEIRLHDPTDGPADRPTDRPSRAVPEQKIRLLKGMQ